MSPEFQVQTDNFKFNLRILNSELNFEFELRLNSIKDFWVQTWFSKFELENNFGFKPRISRSDNFKFKLRIFGSDLKFQVQISLSSSQNLQSSDLKIWVKFLSHVRIFEQSIWGLNLEILSFKSEIWVRTILSSNSLFWVQT